MKIHEYQGKELLRRLNVPVPKGKAALSLAEAEQAIDWVQKETGNPVVVVKAQIHAGGRGKGGGVKVAKTRAEAIELAKKIFGDLSGLSVLILGAGEMAELTGVHLRAQQVRHITIASRTLASAEALARQLTGEAIPWQELPRALAAADIVVTATGASDPVLTRVIVEEAMRHRRQRPLFVVDIALPPGKGAGAMIEKYGEERVLLREAATCPRGD